MAHKPWLQKLKDSFGRDSRDTDFNRRRVLQSGATAAFTSAVGLSAAGSASASKGSPNVVRRTASLKRLKAAEPLLEELASEGLISEASVSAFSPAPLGKNDSGSAVLKYGDRVVHTFVIRSNGTKLTVNLSENENPYALYAPTGSGPGKRIHYEQVEGTVESFEMEYEETVTTQSCGDNCGGTTCSPAGNCWWDKRRCEESCATDGGGYTYCHEDCCCCC